MEHPEWVVEYQRTGVPSPELASVLMTHTNIDPELEFVFKENTWPALLQYVRPNQTPAS
jgi:hypothetical protein